MNPTLQNTIAKAIAQSTNIDTERQKILIQISKYIETKLSNKNTAELIFTSLSSTNGTLGNLTGSDNSGGSGTTQGERNGNDASNGLNNYYDSSDISTTLQSLD